MITAAIIAFREFLEAFLIIGVFFGTSRKLKLHKEREIALSAIVGIILSLALTVTVYVFGERIRSLLTEENADMIEGLILVFSGFFIVYVIFSLHEFMKSGRDLFVKRTNDKLENSFFDISLFITIMFLVLREGFEVALFTAGTSLFSTFIQNIFGLVAGFAISAAAGAIVLFVYEAFPVRKLFRATEYLIVFVGAALLQHGVTILTDYFLHFDLSRIASFGLGFLPEEDTFAGHLLQGLFGIDRDLSGARLAIMAAYLGVVYLLFLKEKKADT